MRAPTAKRPVGGVPTPPLKPLKEAGKTIGDGLKNAGGKFIDRHKKFGDTVRGAVDKVNDKLGIGGKINYHRLTNPLNGVSVRMRRNPEKQREEPGFNRPNWKAFDNRGSSGNGSGKSGLGTLFSFTRNIGAPIVYDKRIRREKNAPQISYQRK